MEENIRLLISAALEAGNRILEVYKNDFSVQFKSDESPLTLADLQSNAAIKEALISTGIPILSEEEKQLPFEERKNWQRFWLVDPLDGTKEFIKKNGEFTVNIALIENGEPVAGVVYVPVTGKLYFGDNKNGSFCFNISDKLDQDVENIIEKAEKIPVAAKPLVYTVVASRSHNTPETQSFIEDRKRIHKEINIVSAGSSIKLCLVAEGLAQVYPRLAPTMEWDTAAGHAVAKFAGCKVYNYETGNELEYNKENLLNPWFVVERV